MGDRRVRAMAGSCIGSVLGLLLGMCIGGFIGNASVRPPDLRPGAELVNDTITLARWTAGFFGTIVGGLAGIVAGGAVGAGVATGGDSIAKRKHPPTKDDRNPKEL